MCLLFLRKLVAKELQYFSRKPGWWGLRGWLSSQRSAMVTGFGHANRASFEWKCAKIASENVRSTENQTIHSQLDALTLMHMFTYARAHTRSATDHHALQQLDKLIHTCSLANIAAYRNKQGYDKFTKGYTQYTNSHTQAEWTFLTHFLFNKNNK